MIGVLEYEGGLYNENGIDVDALKDHMIANDKMVSKFEGATFIPEDGILDK